MDYRIQFENLEWDSPLPGMRCKVARQGDRQGRLVEYSREMAPHWCHKGHHGLVLEGRFEIEFDNTTELYETGDGVFIPAGPEHRHRGRVLTERVQVIFVEDV